MEEKIAEKKQAIEELNIIDDTSGLEEEEVVRRNRVTAELMRCLNWKDNILAQKAKVNWIRDGDANSKLFHKWINKRAKQNEIIGVRWWKDISNIYHGKEGRGMVKELVRIVGEGENTYFWTDSWVGDGTLRERFPRLHILSNNKEAMGIDDHWRWTSSGNGVFNTRDAYHGEAKETTPNRDKSEILAFKRLWKIVAPRSHQAIVWKILNKKVPTRVEL
ncbi:hypothetical protein ACS0TY_022276 [Phlomoides rotata]